MGSLGPGIAVKCSEHDFGIGEHAKQASIEHVSSGETVAEVITESEQPVAQHGHRVGRHAQRKSQSDTVPGGKGRRLNRWRASPG